jgi:hypothetical protein
VEGVTDRLYLRRYLDLLQKYEMAQDASLRLLREDIEYSFVEYSGSNVVHWSFLDAENGVDVSRLCAPLLIVLDRDSVSESTSKGKRFKLLKEKLGEDHVCVLPVREVENLLSAAVLKRVVQDYEGQDVEIPTFTEKDYGSKYMGHFIEDKLLSGRSVRRPKPSSACGPYSANRNPKKSGTIKDKDKFCEKALGHIESLDDLSPNAVAVARHLIKFIRDHNR